MAINRITPITYPSGGFQDWAYIDDTPAGATMFDFIADGTEDTNTVANARYRVLYYYTPGSYSLTFDRPGKIDFLMVAGGGSGGSQYADNQGAHRKGGGGAGGFILNYNHIPTSSISLVVGAGGISTTSGSNGGDTTFSSFTAVGGGRGGINQNGVGYSGGSGGGGSGSGGGGAGTFEQGNSGGYNSSGGGGGGGGAGGAAGSEGGDITYGGPGIRKNFDGTWRWYAAGGNANGTYNSQGQTSYQVHADTGNPGVPGAGGGGDYYGGGGTDIWSKRGGKGIVIVRFRVA